jgi:hypothetical protein
MSLAKSSDIFSKIPSALPTHPQTAESIIPLAASSRFITCYMPNQLSLLLHNNSLIDLYTLLVGI